MKVRYSDSVMKATVNGTTIDLQRINGDDSVYRIGNDGDLIKVDINVPDWQSPLYPSDGPKPQFTEWPVANNINSLLTIVLQKVIEKAGGTVTEINGKSVATAASNSTENNGE